MVIDVACGPIACKTQLLAYLLHIKPIVVFCDGMGIPGIFFEALFTWYLNILMQILQNVFTFDVKTFF